MLELLVSMGVLFFITEFCDFIPPFVARKLTHMLSGLIVMHTNINDSSTRFTVMMVAIIVPLTTWLIPLRFTKSKDLGVTLFGMVVCFWAYYYLPFIYLSPLLIADPTAALVGHYITTRRWNDDKTILGSTIFFLVSLALLIRYEKNMVLALFVAALTTITEGVGGGWDNLFLAFPLLGHYIIRTRL